MKKQHSLGKLFDFSNTQEEAFISTIFCPYCNERTLVDIVDGTTYDGEIIDVVVCIECDETINLTNDVTVKLYTPTEAREAGWDLFEIIEKLERDDRWSKIKPWAN